MTAEVDLLSLGLLARRYGMARSSLLHYESLGLLRPALRSAAGYRLYGKNEIERLETIRRYRQAGLSLEAIAGILSDRRDRDSPAAQIEARLISLSRDIDQLRHQQQALARLLAVSDFRRDHPARNKEEWVALLRQAGFSEEDMAAWHRSFEAEAPEGHRAFLHTLGLSADEVEQIRQAAGSGQITGSGKASASNVSSG